MATKYEESKQPNNTRSTQTRRSALKKMLVGTGVVAGAAALPDKWTKPLVDRVLVPAHAQTSQDPCFYYISCYFEYDPQENLLLQIERAHECPDDFDPADPTGVMVDITTISSNPAGYPCPGNISVPLDATGKASVIVYPCGGQSFPTELTVEVKFHDQARWGTNTSTCTHQPR